MQDIDLLWQQFLEGDMQALGKIMSLYYRDLFYYGSKFSKDGDFVEDAIQDLFLGIWEKRNSINGTIPAKAYLMACLRRSMHRATKAQHRFMPASIESVDAGFELSFSVEQSYIEQESAQHSLLQIRQSVEGLPARQKEVIYLKYFQSMDRSQISEVMGISPQTVSNLLQMALGQLKKHIKVEFLTLFLLHFLV
ncbi:RNA polymerase sigma factor (sigma-70 family) [Dyadobacter jejuensis]|uniref:RNA polymerase sigma factor (Sigma-70 family) n=1 Tax=Dyadobacter jejuensis TaxID=1082580 RepID=A0A316APP9_9BACT|nr:sigma-70 family RNA polymerase sigma factor [Dyadobacter jejuensis]PWJ59396.1 RNA polymerase sigma factor (sigma-70 family) [Dyadobacter jejuensis]